MKPSERAVKKKPDGPDHEAAEMGPMMHNAKAEKAVLGSLLLDPERLDDVADVLRGEDFADPVHQGIFDAMMQLWSSGKRPDELLVLERLAASSGAGEPIGATYLFEVANSVPHALSAAHYAGIVADLARVRALWGAARETLDDISDTTIDCRTKIARAESRIFAIAERGNTASTRHISDVLRESLARYEKGGERGLSWQYSALDDVLTLRPGELTILAARPGVGKSAFATNVVERLIRKPEHAGIVFFSLEMGAAEIITRLLSIRSRVHSYRITSGNASNHDRELLVKTSADMSAANLFIVDNARQSMLEIAANARRIKRRHGLGLVIVDYLQLIEPDDRREPRQEQVASIAKRLKWMARELAIPVLCLCQLNRRADDNPNEIPKLSHLRESGAIEQDADNVLFLWRRGFKQDSGDKTPDNATKIVVAKQRNGPSGEVDFAWFPETIRFELAADQRYDESRQQWGNFNNRQDESDEYDQQEAF